MTPRHVTYRVTRREAALLYYAVRAIGKQIEAEDQSVILFGIAGRYKDRNRLSALLAKLNVPVIRKESVK